GILTAAIETRHQIGLDSYDRLFPNQDTLPKGGFGNLIALPLQGRARRQGNTVFLDDDFNPHPDQWAFLAGVRKLSLEEINKNIQSFKKREFIAIDTPMASSHEPWTLPPSGERVEKLDNVVLPKKVKIVAGNLVYVEKKNLPPALINRIIRLAAFQNPEFYKAQAMRLSTYGKPGIISCSEDFEHHIAIPRGLLDSLLTLFSKHGIEVEIADERNCGIPVEVNFQGGLRTEQLEAGKKILDQEIGVLSLPTAFGKTVIASWVISRRKTNTLVLVHRRQLLEQWLAQLSIFLDLPSDKIGQIGAGKNKPTRIVDIGIIQSLNRKGQINDIVAEYGQVIVDECHHVPAFSFESILKQVRAKYVLGLTATPVRKDGHHPIILMQCGPVRHHIKKLSGSFSQFKRQVIIRKTSFQFDETDEHVPIQAIYAALIEDEQRNDFIFNDVLTSLENKRSPLLLTERTSHLHYFANRLKGFAKNIIVLKGGLSSKKLRTVMDRIASIPHDEERIILATGRYIGEGFDDGRLDTLFLVMPISWKGTLQQYVGRLHRRHANKKLVQVFDYVDAQVPMLSKMFQRRLRGYHSLGYQVGEDGGSQEAWDF
ncbi:DEAD/DEAH box helicase family protein, partial [candidate division KSB1 bacterium]|nr:DEAD/DEAH box helicase family protein [candidate division KSB1 bacterium]